jgi:uncharacterized membrane protein
MADSAQLDIRRPNSTEVCPDVRGAPAAPAGGCVEDRSGTGEDDGASGQRRASTPLARGAGPVRPASRGPQPPGNGMESLSTPAARHVAHAVQATAILIIVVGSARALVGIARTAFASHLGEPEPRVVRLDYARALFAALTFQLAAGVVGTSFSPLRDEFGRLATVAAFLAFLGCFLDREVEQTARWMAAKPAAPGATASPCAD